EHEHEDEGRRRQRERPAAPEEPDDDDAQVTQAEDPGGDGEVDRVGEQTRDDARGLPLHRARLGRYDDGRGRAPWSRNLTRCRLVNPHRHYFSPSRPPPPSVPSG